MSDYTHHPAAAAFPMMDKERYTELRINIAQQGQLVPIVLCDGQVLDGRNRLKACLELGILPRFEEYSGDPWAYVWSMNGERRDLVAEQRYLIWKFCHEKSMDFQFRLAALNALANDKRSASQKGITKRELKDLTKERMNTKCVRTFPVLAAKASASKTNRGAVLRGDKLVARRPDLAEKVRQGVLKPSEAHRQAKRDEVAGKVRELPKDKFVVIYADPPWEYSDRLSGSISNGYGGAEKHYPTMPLSDLKALGVSELAAPDSVLFLWATCPLLEYALELCSAWGFTYKAQFVWDKIKHNMGHYNSVRHELLLIATKGSCTPQKAVLHDSVQSIERAKHSEKPGKFYEIIEELYPLGAKIELFARSKRDGWESWGNEF